MMLWLLGSSNSTMTIFVWYILVIPHFELCENLARYNIILSPDYLRSSHGFVKYHAAYNLCILWSKASSIVCGKRNKANLRDLMAATGLLILLKLHSNRRLFWAVWPWNLMDNLKKTIEHFCYATSSFVHHFVALVNSNWSYSPEMPNLAQNRRFFLALWPWNLTDDLQKQ